MAENENNIYMATRDTVIEELNNKKSVLYSGTSNTMNWQYLKQPTTTISGYGNCSVDGENGFIYIFGTDTSSTYYKYAYKYDILENTYTRIADIPYNFYNGSCVKIPNTTLIYLFGGSDYPTYCYVYDISTDTYTKKDNSIPFSLSGGNAVYDDTTGLIDLLGGGNSPTSHYTYNYITDTYTSSVGLPYSFYYGASVFINGDLYIFGSANGNYTYCYVLYKNATAWSARTSSSYYTHYARCLCVGNEIHVFGGGQYPQYLQIYNIEKNTWTYYSNIPYSFQHGYMAYANNTIFFFGGSSSSVTWCKKLKKRIFLPKNAQVYMPYNGAISKDDSSGEVLLTTNYDMKNVNDIPVVNYKSYTVEEEGFYYISAYNDTTIII